MSMPEPKTSSLKHNQQGFASIVIALILIVVLALLTVGFAQLARREQQNALDKQLASQAYYASESGINDTELLIQKVLASPAGIPGVLPSLDSLTPPSAGLGGNEDPNTCLDKQSFPGIPNGNISTTTGVSYSCILLDLTPPNLVWTGISPGADRDSSFSTTGSLNSLTLYWGSGDNQQTPQAAPSPDNEFNPEVTGGSGWGAHPAVLEVSLTPLADLNRTSMINNTFTAYLYPSTGGGLVHYDLTKQGQVVSGNCSGTGAFPCSVTIDQIPNTTGASEQYLIHIFDYYDQSNVSVGNALNTVSGAQLDFVDGQAQIDVTGRARTVLKRLQVRAPLTESAPVPPYALEGGNICKRFSTFPGSLTPDTLSPSCNLN